MAFVLQRVTRGAPLPYHQLVAEGTAQISQFRSLTDCVFNQHRKSKYWLVQPFGERAKHTLPRVPARHHYWNRSWQV